MGTAVTRWLDRWSVAAGYAGALVLAALAVSAQPLRERATWYGWASTNLANLHDHPVRAMVFSAVLSEGVIAGWVVMAVVGLAACAAALGAWRTLLLVGAAHVVGTLVSQGIVAYRIGHGALGATAATMSDIGPSYVVTTALVAGLAYGPRAGRVASGACLALLLPGLFGGLPDLAVASVGHACSVVVALGLGAPLALRVRRRRRTAAPAHRAVPAARTPDDDPAGRVTAHEPPTGRTPGCGPPPAGHGDAERGGGQTRYSTSQ